VLSKKAKYGLKALEFIAKQDSKIPVHTSAISLAESIPRKFLETILLDLKHDGILKSKQGKNKGKKREAERGTTKNVSGRGGKSEFNALRAPDRYTPRSAS
jgi:hypothetical protein